MHLNFSLPLLTTHIGGRLFQWRKTFNIVCSFVKIMWNYFSRLVIISLSYIRRCCKTDICILKVRCPSANTKGDSPLLPNDSLVERITLRDKVLHLYVLRETFHVYYILTPLYKQWVKKHTALPYLTSESMALLFYIYAHELPPVTGTGYHYEVMAYNYDNQINQGTVLWVPIKSGLVICYLLLIIFIKV